jgi:ribosomal protein S18 acetylase RimI-like enzyme
VGTSTSIGPLKVAILTAAPAPSWGVTSSLVFTCTLGCAAITFFGPLCQPGCVELVHADAAEAKALRDLHVLTWEVTYRPSAQEEWYGERLRAHSVRDWGEIVRSQTVRGGGVLTARSGGRIDGLCQYGPTEDHDHDPEQVGQIHRLYVHPARQRTGIGRSLLTASVGHLRQGGAHTATLWVLETDQGARAFYERLGWKPDGARQSHPPIDLRYQLPLL